MQKLALLSVSDKSGLVEFATQLVNSQGYTLLSTGGTAKALMDAKLPVIEVSEHTGFPEMMNGRLKTLHPKIHGGILCRRDLPEHTNQAQQNGIPLIDLVVVNLYPFQETIRRQNCTLAEAIENIDIGGPAMLRSAAKNHNNVTVVCDPADYTRVVEGLKNNSLETLRKELALKTFQHTSQYDKAIASYLETQKSEPDLEAISALPAEYNLTLKKEKSLRYGENPHQQAALYGNFFDCYEQLQGKELSFNNILDITAATYLIGEFEKPTAAILKHNNPCGVGSDESLEGAWEHALATDKKSPFGGIIVLNRTLDAALAEIIKELFSEVIIAPEFTPEAQEVLKAKKNLRLMRAKQIVGFENLQEVRSVVGGVLVQDRDFRRPDPSKFKVVTKRQPTQEEWVSLLFGWRIVKHVKSNAIVYGSGERTLGIGAGQMSRVDSSEIAIQKAKNAGLSLKNSVVASDAFFPFPDGLVAAAEAGATAAIQPGGSKGDPSVIEAANEHDVAMVFTNMRHFKH